MELTQQQLDAFKKLYPRDMQLQIVTLDEIAECTEGGEVDWSKVNLGGVADSAVLTASDPSCGMAIGYVVFDAICLFIGAASLRSSLTAKCAAEIGEAAGPIESALEQYIEVLMDSNSSTTANAGAVFNIVSTIYSGGCMGAVLSAMFGNLSWYQNALYGATALGTIVAALATDGAAEIGILIVELATAGFLVNDSITCARACKYN